MKGIWSRLLRQYARSWTFSNPRFRPVSREPGRRASHQPLTHSTLTPDALAVEMTGCPVDVTCFLVSAAPPLAIAVPGGHSGAIVTAGVVGLAACSIKTGRWSYSKRRNGGNAPPT